MKAKILCFLAAAVLMTAALMAPQMVGGQIQSTGVTYMANANYIQTVKVTGTVEEIAQTPVTLPYPVVCEKILVREGERVVRGQTLFTVDKTSTLYAYQDFLAGNNINAALTSVKDLLGLLSQLPQQAGALVPEGLLALAKQAQGAVPDSFMVSDLLQPELLAAEVVAPADGVITRIGAGYTALSQAGQPLAVIAPETKMQIRVPVPESEVAQIQVGQNAAIVPKAGTGATTAVVTEVSASARQQVSLQSTQTVVDVYLEPENIEGLKPGYNVAATISIGETRLLQTLPYQVIRQDAENREYVYLLQGATAVKRMITTGREFGDCVQVVSGLSAGEAVLTGEGVAENNLVRVVADPPPQS